MTKFSSKIIIILILIVIAGFFFLNRGDEPAVEERMLINPDLEGVVTYEVVLTKDGYKPNEITIKKGEAIIFSITGGNLFWPASNIHPSHYIYSEFDPKIPVKPEQTWAFIFDRVGAWKYHDHLNPIYTGVIKVEE